MMFVIYFVCHLILCGYVVLLTIIYFVIDYFCFSFPILLYIKKNSYQYLIKIETVFTSCSRNIILNCNYKERNIS